MFFFKDHQTKMLSSTLFKKNINFVETHFSKKKKYILKKKSHTQKNAYLPTYFFFGPLQETHNFF